jgi:hypothetical protein
MPPCVCVCVCVCVCTSRRGGHGGLSDPLMLEGLVRIEALSRVPLQTAVEETDEGRVVTPQRCQVV